MNRDLVAIGASAGGVEALKQIASDLPEDLPAAVLVAVHIAPESQFYLPEILTRAGPLKAFAAEEGLEVKSGQIIVARPGFHMLLRDGHVHLGTGPRENRARPAIDPLFRSVAATYRGRAIGVILSGWLNDGTSGLYAIKRCGGTTVVQDPEDAMASEMPRNAAANVDVDHTVPLDQIGSLLGELTRLDAQADFSVPADIRVESDIALHGGQAMVQTAHLGVPSQITCPECGGQLTEVANSNTLRFRCHVGHAHTAETLLSEQTEAIDRALLSALKTMEERAAMWSRLAKKNADDGNQRVAASMQGKADSSKIEADLIRDLLESRRQAVHSARHTPERSST